MKNEKINFIFRSLNKRIILIGFIIEALLDVIYYLVPFSFTLFLTLPFTVKKAFIVIGVFLLSKILHLLGNYILTNLSDNYLYDYSNTQYEEFYKKLLKLPVEVLNKYQTGYFENIIEKVSCSVKKILTAEYVSIIISFAFLFYTLFNQSLVLFVISLFTSILCVIMSIAIIRKANNQVETLYNEEYKYSSVYNDFISNVRTVKLLNNNPYFLNKVKKAGKRCFREQKKYVRCYSTEALLRNALIIVPFFLGLLKAIIDLSNGIDTIGIITFYISLQVEMDFIFEELSETIISWYELKSIKKRLKNIFTKLDERKIVEDFEEIVYRDIKISYPKSEIEICIDEMHILKGDKISIMGKSGQGKTTLVNFILGNNLYYKGVAKIDGVDMYSVKLDVGVVSQEIELFNMTIRENLCLDRKISDEELNGYLRELELNELFLFKDGLDTVVGEKGLKFSTGQKRRINILRSFLMNKETYILDEPLSNLDEHTEKIVSKFIKKRFMDKTLIIITHDDLVNDVCDKHYVFKNHKLIQKK